MPASRRDANRGGAVLWTDPSTSASRFVRWLKSIATSQSGQQVEVLIASWHRVDIKFIPALEDDDDGLQEPRTRTASSAATPCFDAPGWTLTLRSGRARRGLLRICSSRSSPPSHLRLRVLRPSAEPRRPASARCRVQGVHDRDASTPQRRSRSQPLRPTSRSAPQSPPRYRKTKMVTAPDPLDRRQIGAAAARYLRQMSGLPDVPLVGGMGVKP